MDDPNPQPESISASTVYKLIAAAGAPLSAAGFVQVGKRQWVRTARPPIRHLISFWPPSWYGVAPSWGLSLDDVPHVSHHDDFKVRWTTGPADADYHLLYDPLDYEDWQDRSQIQRWSVRRDHGRDAAREGVVRLLPDVLAAAADLFDRVNDRAGVVAAVEAQLARPRLRYGRGTGGALRPQEQLALAFTLARMGRGADGRAWLARFVTGDPLMPRATRRRRAVMHEAAAAGAEPLDGDGGG